MRHLEHIKLFMYTRASFIQASLCCVHICIKSTSASQEEEMKDTVWELRESYSMLTLDALKICISKPLKFHLDIHNRPFPCA